MHKKSLLCSHLVSQKYSFWTMCIARKREMERQFGREWMSEWRGWGLEGPWRCQKQCVCLCVCTYMFFPGCVFAYVSMYVCVVVVTQWADIKYLFKPSFHLQRCFTLCFMEPHSSILTVNEGWEAKEWQSMDGCLKKRSVKCSIPPGCIYRLHWCCHDTKIMTLILY